MNENDKVSEIDRKLKELTIRHDAALELIGSKEEELLELRADISDMKQVYRDQVSELMDQIDQLRKS